MIARLHPLPVGNAIRVFLSPPVGASRWRVLRRDDVGFGDAFDPGAKLVYHGDDPSFLDLESLRNGRVVFYRPYYLIAGDWVPGAVVEGAAKAWTEGLAKDPLSTLRDRIEAGLSTLISQGVIFPPGGVIPVLEALPPIDLPALPIVSIHLESSATNEHAVGGEAVGENAIGKFSHFQIAIVGWSLNPSERKSLRWGLQNIMLANWSVFTALGWTALALDFKDVDLPTEQGPPLYQAAGSFGFVVQIGVTDGLWRGGGLISGEDVGLDPDFFPPPPLPPEIGGDGQEGGGWSPDPPVDDIAIAPPGSGGSQDPNQPPEETPYGETRTCVR